MKKLSFYWVLVFVVIGCDSENALDCFQTAGNQITLAVSTPDFNRILVLPNVSVVLKEGPETEVLIETGENLINEVNVRVENNRLILEDTNDCNFTREFNTTTIYVTAPNIIEIRSATQYMISSDGVLGYPRLRLLSEDYNEDNQGNLTGEFDLEVSSEDLRIISNSIASFKISGDTDFLYVGFFSGTSRFEGDNLIANNIRVYHRGTNKMIVNPVLLIRGELRSTGDVIALQRPPSVEVQEYFTGRLLFSN